MKNARPRGTGTRQRRGRKTNTQAQQNITGEGIQAGAENLQTGVQGGTGADMTRLSSQSPSRTNTRARKGTGSQRRGSQGAGRTSGNIGVGAAYGMLARDCQQLIQAGMTKVEIAKFVNALF